MRCFCSSPKRSHRPSKHPSYTQGHKQPPQIIALPDSLVEAIDKRYLGFCLPEPGHVHIRSRCGSDVDQGYRWRGNRAEEQCD